MLNKSIENNKQILNDKLRVDKSFDLIRRDIVICKHKSALYFIDGLIKDEVMEKIMEFFYSISDESYLKDAQSFCENCVPYVEVNPEEDIDKISMNVLSGITALIIDGIDKAIMLDTRTYPQRHTSEPENDKVLRGSKDGFVETMISNCGLIRRRIRDTQFTVKAMIVGRDSKTDIAVCYMDNKVDKNLLNTLIHRINSIDVQALTMNQQSFIEALYNSRWINPFPKVKYTERPDTAASAILKGNIVILVDNAPSALLMPTSIFDVLEEADDYYFPPITGTYLRLARYFITIASVIITPLWILCLQNPEFVPQALKFILLTEPYNIPVFWQLIIIEIGIDGLRLASLNTPNSLTTPLGIIGAIALSDFAVNAGWFAMESILYMAFVTIANYTQPSYELGYSLKFMRIILLILTVLFNVWGFALGFIINIILLFTNKTLSGKSFMYPLYPFNGKELLKKLIRINNLN